MRDQDFGKNLMKLLGVLKMVRESIEMEGYKVGE